MAGRPTKLLANIPSIRLEATVELAACERMATDIVPVPPVVDVPVRTNWGAPNWQLIESADKGVLPSVGNAPLAPAPVTPTHDAGESGSVIVVFVGGPVNETFTVLPVVDPGTIVKGCEGTGGGGGVVA
jgi:hypothetical protein